MDETENDLDVQLTNEQKLLILNKWNENPLSPPSISDLVQLTFPEAPSFDGRTKHGRVIRSFLAQKGLEAETTEYRPKGLMELTEEQKEYVANNCGTMKAIEMARILFNNPQLRPTSQESKSIFHYAKSLEAKINVMSQDEPPNEDYKPPKIIEHAATRINKYKKDANFDPKKLNHRQKKQCQSLISYLHTYRFIHQMNTYQSVTDRTLFESTFIKYTHDKEDLTEEDVDQYIILSAEVVISANIQRTIDMLQEEQDRVIAEQGKMSMTLVEAITSARTEYNASVKRQQSLYKDLVHERSKRIKAEKEGANILNLVAIWKEERTRKQMIALAEQRKQKIKDTIRELSSMEDVKARIYGISESEILN